MKKFLIGLTALIMMTGFQISGYALEIESAGVDIHGFISQGFLKSSSYNYLANDSNKGSFQFNEVGINFGKQVTDNLRIGAQFFARDLGDVSNNKVTLDWAYGDYWVNEWLGIRAGRLKIPFGLYGDIRDMDMLRSFIVLPQGMYNELLRESMSGRNGAMLYGTIPMSKAGSLEYQLQAGIGNVDASSGTSKYIASKVHPLAVVSDFNTKIGYTGALRWNTPLSGLALKTTLYTTEYDMPVAIGPVSLNIGIKNFYQIYSLEYIRNNLTIAAEYMTLKIDQTIAGATTTIRDESYYGMVSYRFTNWLETGAYYSINYPDSERDKNYYSAIGQPEYYAWQKDAALFARFDINNYLTLKLEGHYVDGVVDVLSIDNPVRDDRNWWYFAAKATFSF